MIRADKRLQAVQCSHRGKNNYLLGLGSIEDAKHRSLISLKLWKLGSHLILNVITQLHQFNWLLVGPRHKGHLKHIYPQVSMSESSRRVTAVQGYRRPRELALST